VLSGGGLHCVYQQFVDLGTGSILACEALLRGPAGSGWEPPMVLLDAALAAGRLADLEWASLQGSLADAARLSEGRPVTLFVTVEPSTLTQRSDVPGD
jgi:EAL domain-containing protein (putative c-di-GMP-specific phosphodiesterase class I)